MEQRPGNLAAIAQRVNGGAGPGVPGLTPIPDSPWQHSLPRRGTCKERDHSLRVQCRVL